MNHDPKLQLLGDALHKLDEALCIARPTDLEVDGTIQRYKLPFDLTCRLLRQHLAEHGIAARTPREILAKACDFGFIADREMWFRGLQDRMKTPYLYERSRAHAVYKDIKQLFPMLKSAHLMLIAR